MSEPRECQSLEEVRSEIDEIDRMIVALIGKRYEYVKAAADFKKTEADVRAPGRLKTVIDARRQWAADLGLDPDFVENLYRNMIDHFISAELELLGKRRS